ncbi:hypothetical protein [Pendulispora albinea]|uniref:Tetratricopeptide repeat protein n=1 Tax=Pendulispora albinea TaxID=2741071 RepID=A0ABZ2MBN3_9BACT
MALDLRWGDPEALAALANLYEKQGMWRDLVEVLERTLAIVPNEDDRLNILTRRARIFIDKLGRDDKAIADYQRILEIDRANLVALRSIATIWRRQQDANQLVLALHQIVGRASHILDPEELKDVFRELAMTYLRVLGRPEDAAEAWRKLLEIEPDPDAMDALENLYRSGGRWLEVIDVKMMRAEALTVPAAKIDEYWSVAAIWTSTLRRPEDAAGVYEKILQIDPSNHDAFGELERAHRRASRWPQLIDLLISRLDSGPEKHEKIALLHKIAQVCEDGLDDPNEAFVALTSALEEDVHDVSSVRHIERVAGKTGLWDDLIRTATGWLDDEATQHDPKKKIRILLHLAHWNAQAGHAEYAQAYYAQIEELVPKNANALEVYREVLKADPTNMHALMGCARIHEALHQWNDLARVLEAALEGATTERERIDVLLRLARLDDEHFVRPEMVSQRLEQVLEIDPTSEDAYEALERSYKKLRKWKELVKTYQRHLRITDDRQTKVRIYLTIAQIHTEEVPDPQKTIEAYEHVVALDDSNVEANGALAKLYESQGNSDQSIEHMTRLAELTRDPQERAEAYYRIGKAIEQKHGNRLSAQDRYDLAIGFDPSHIKALAAARTIATENGDYERAVRYLDQEQSHTPHARTRSRLLMEMGRLHQEKLGNHESAILAFEAAYQADDDNEEAALQLIDDYIDRKEWAKAEGPLELVIRKATKKPRNEQLELHKKLGHVCLSLGKDDKALKAFTAAYRFDVTDLVTVRGMADAAFRLRDWNAALTKYHKLLTSLPPDEKEIRADVYFKLGCMKREQGFAKQAIANFEKAFTSDEVHKPTLEACISLYTESKDWKQVAALKRKIVDGERDPEAKFVLLQELADIWVDKAKNLEKALEALEEARAIKPNLHPLLHRIVMLYQQAENWPRVIEMVLQMASLDRDPTRKSKYISTVAQIYREKMNDEARAIEVYNEALDLNPNLLEAFERIVKMLTANKDWKGLERSFRKMLRRLTHSTNAELLHNLWHNLGVIYRDRLNDVPSAIEAFKMAARAGQEHTQDRQILAELFEATNQTDAAIVEHTEVLKANPTQAGPYRSLCKLYLARHEYDRAWCMCAALSFMHQADPNEQQFFESYRPRRMLQVRNRLCAEHWIKNLFHQEENLYIDKIFEMIIPAAIVAKLNQLKAANQLPALDRRYRQDPATSTVTLAKTFGWAAQVLGVQAPELYVRTDIAGSLLAVPYSPPASVAGQTILSGFTPQELTFIVGKHLTYYRGGHYMRNLFPSLNELKVMLFAAVKIVKPNFNVPSDVAEGVKGAAAELVKYMQPIQRDSLRVIVERFIEEGMKVDLKKWAQTVEVTAMRAGLLLCADLEIAKKIIVAEPQLPGDMAPQDKLKELVLFSVSEPYFNLRETLGIAVAA